MEKSLNTPETIQTQSYKDQKAGTSGLRKKVTVFKQQNYLENFVQSIFNVLDSTDYIGKSLVVSGDGRFYNDTAIQAIIRISAANGVRKVIVGQNGLLSTPAVSALVRKLNEDNINSCCGAIILTASHNPGGEHEDFGIKFNMKNGGPAYENITDKIFEQTLAIKEYKLAKLSDVNFNIKDVHSQNFGKVAGFDHDFELEIVDSTKNYVELMSKIFDFEKIKKLVHRKDFKLCFDGMHGVGGPYGHAVFEGVLGLSPDCLLNCEPSQDFGGGHPDPNLTYAEQLVEIMGVKPGHHVEDAKVPDFGAACDGDADRNMILGKKFFVTPSDSLAIIAANYQSIPYFSGGLKGVARSMPTSRALDRVAKKLGLECYEVPTGWKFFGNLMDAGKLSICGEESFGTGSDHVREKDGLWAVLAWLSVIAEKNKNTEEGKLMSVKDIVQEHWNTFGRDYYTRYDYEGLKTEEADKVMELLRTKFDDFNKIQGNCADIFEYTDPVDGSVSKNQGIRFHFADGSRIVYRLSGTGSSGATVRIYIETTLNDFTKSTEEATKSNVEKALEFSNIHAISGRKGPTVIT